MCSFCGFYTGAGTSQSCSGATVSAQKFDRLQGMAVSVFRSVRQSARPREGCLHSTQVRHLAVTRAASVGSDVSRSAVRRTVTHFRYGGAAGDGFVIGERAHALGLAGEAGKPR